MDLRTERTKRSIINAFLELRSKKPIEKITIRELAELAFINKATFYLHYRDIYDLSEQLENEVLDRIVAAISSPEDLLTRPGEATERLAVACLSQSRLIEILFLHNRTSILVNRLDERIKERIYEVYPEYRNDLEKDIILTFLIQGSFYAYLSHSGSADQKQLIEIVRKISERMLE